MRNTRVVDTVIVAIIFFSLTDVINCSCMQGRYTDKIIFDGWKNYVVSNRAIDKYD